LFSLHLLLGHETLQKTIQNFEPRFERDNFEIRITFVWLAISALQRSEEMDKPSNNSQGNRTGRTTITIRETEQEEQQ
jgi:hypothetical protein